MTITQARVQIIKRLPAPRLDGFDVKDLRVNVVCDVEPRLANYLVLAGYAKRLVDQGPLPRRMR